MKREIHRVEVQINKETPVLQVQCTRCGQPVVLWFNGGELDYKKCHCGRLHSLQHGTIYYVVEHAKAD